MAIPLLELEGTWEEITARVPDFSGRILHVIVLPVEERNDKDTRPLSDDPRLAVLREIEVRSQQMNPKPDTRDWLREGRSGGMFGHESAE